MNRSPRMSSRTRARKRAIDVIFEADQKGIIDDAAAFAELLAQRRTLSAAQTPLPAYADTVVQGVCDHLDDIDDLLVRFSRGWSLERMPAADRATMRAAVWEIVYNDDVDAPVAINEAMAIIRGIGTDKSPKFVNGVLAAIARWVADNGSVSVSAGIGQAEAGATDEADQVDEALAGDEQSSDGQSSDERSGDEQSGDDECEASAVAADGEDMESDADGGPDGCRPDDGELNDAAACGGDKDGAEECGCVSEDSLAVDEPLPKVVDDDIDEAIEDEPEVEPMVRPKAMGLNLDDALVFQQKKEDAEQ